MLWKCFVAASITAFAIGGSTACASKKFVRQNVGEVNEKVDSMGRSIEETQERTRRNEGRITEVDSKAQAAAQSAQQAHDAASAANSLATTANSATDARANVTTIWPRRCSRVAVINIPSPCWQSPRSSSSTSMLGPQGSSPRSGRRSRS